MKWILAACLFVATYAVVPSLDKAYEPGWRYTYNYDAQLLTGVPTVTDQLSGFRVKGDAHFQFSQQSNGLKVSLKLDNVVIYKVHGNVGKDVLPSDLLPEHLLEDITNTEEGKILQRQLIKPCSFNYNDGDISDLKVEESEPYWSVNFKKGIVHLQKIHLKNNNVHYTVTEEDIVGRCESQYTLSQMRPFLKVDKVRHMDSCTEKPIVEVGLFSGLPETEQKLLQPTVHYNYVLYTENNKFAIKEVEVKSTYSVTPTQKETDSIVTYTNQRMVFSELRQIRTPLNIESASKVQESLMYVVPNPLISSQYDRKTFFNERTNTNDRQLTNLEDLLTTIVNKMRTPFIDSTVPEDLMKFNQMLRHFSARDVLVLVRKYSCGDEVCAMKLEMILDCVASLPTDMATEVVITLIKEKIVTGFRASLMINTLALTANPTPALIDQCMQLYKQMTTNPTTEDKMITRSLMLCIGTLANRMINMHQAIGADRQTTKPIQRGLVSELRNLLKSATTTEEKLRLIKTMGNFGEPSLLPELKTICEDKTQPWELREHAIFAMRKFAYFTEIKTQVLDTVLPIFLDANEKTRIRTAAFMIVIKNRPEYRTFETIGHKMETESSHQMQTLVYSVFLKITKTQTNEPWMNKIAEDARRCLKFMTPVEIMPWDTQMMHTEVYSEMMKIGGYLDAIVMKSPDSIIPRALVTYLQGTMFGRYFNLIEAGVVTDGLEKLIQRLIDWIVREGDMSSLFNILSNTEDRVHGSRISEEINSILNKLPVEEMDDTEFMAMAYFKMNTQEMQYIAINKDDLIDLFRSQNLNTILRTLFEGKDFRWTKVVSFLENSLAVPSPVGVPVYVNASAVHVQSFVGHFKIEGLESLIGNILSGDRFSLSSLKLKLKADISTPTKVIVKMGSSLSNIQTGAGTKFQVNSNIPVDVEASFEKTTGKLVIKNKIPDEKVDLFTFIGEPYTYFAKIVNNVYIVKSLKINNPSIETPYTREYSIPLLVLPVSVDVESKLRYGSPSWTAIFPLVGKQEVYITLNKKSVRCPKVLFEFDLTELPYLYECKQESRDSYRYNRGQSDYSDESQLIVVRPDEMFVKKCEAVKIPMQIRTDDNSASRIQTQTTYIRSPNWMAHQLNFQMVGKSLYGLSQGFENIKLITETLVNIENMMQGTSRYPIVKFTIGFGINKFDENKVVVKIVKGAPEHIFEQSYNIQSRKTEDLKLTVDIEYTQVTDEMNTIVETCKYYLQPLYARYLTKLDVTSSAKKQQIKCFVKFTPEWEKVFIVFDLPTGNRYLMKLPWTVPYLRPLALHHPVSVMVPPQNLKMNNMQKFSSYGRCVINKTTMKTFDGHSINLPRVFFDPNCEVVITRDCSSKKSFVLTTKPVGSAGQKAIKLLVPEFKIEVAPSTQSNWFSWNKNVALKIKVDGNQVPLNTHEPLALKSKQSGETLYTITKEEQMIKITCLETGLVVFYDGSVVRVEPKPRIFQGHLCGICGSFNYDRSDDITSTHVTRHESLKEHFFKNIVPSPNCHARAY